MSRTPADHGVPYFPAFLDLVRKRVVVVGGGQTATHKVRSLAPCQPAPLIVVAPEVSATIEQLAADGAVTWLQREFRAEDVVGADLVFAATDDRDLNARIAAAGRQHRAQVLAVDDVPNCDFIAPAIVRRGDVVIAISTGGKSPAMARRVREHLDEHLPRSWGALLDVAATVRERLGATRGLIHPERWQEALRGEVEDLTEEGRLEQATALLLRRLEQDLFATPRTGLVSLVGAGPGDPELLTLKAVRRLQSADAVVYDRLVSEEILAYAPDKAARYDVGKTPGKASTPQADIEELLVELGSAGLRVVRLKGGDPFVFGRGGEEALALARARIPFEIVPGVSAALAAPAAAGIPVTHRGMSASVTIATGHTSLDHDWSALAASAGTLVFLMAVETLDELVEQLLLHGRPADEPAAIVQWATTPRQRTLLAPLAEIAHAARAAELTPPAVLVVGPTAALSAQLAPEGTPLKQAVPV